MIEEKVSESEDRSGIIQCEEERENEKRLRGLLDNIKSSNMNAIDIPEG